MKKTIQWYEKKGKGGYWDKKLWHFIEAPMHGFDDELLLAKRANYIPERKKWYERIWQWLIKSRVQLFTLNKIRHGK